MLIELSVAQQLALDRNVESPPRLIDPRDNATYYLVSASDYELFREVLEDEQRQKAIRAVALRNVVGVLEENP